MRLRGLIARAVASRKFRTQGELAREQMRRRGLPFYADRLDHIEGRLRRLKPAARAAFAAASAQRLLDAHDALPETDRRTFTSGWRTTLDDVWVALGGDDEARARVGNALDAYARSPYDHEDGQDGPDDADDDAAAACIQTAEALVHRDIDAAFGAASRAVDGAFAVANAELDLDQNAFEWRPDAYPPMPLVREAMHPAVEAELTRLEAEIALLEGSPISLATLEVLRSGGGRP